MHTMRYGRASVIGAAALAAVLPAAVASAGHGSDGEPHLVGRAVLPVETYAPGPPSGSALVGGLTDPDGDGVINGIQFPTPTQPVEGFSAIVEGRYRGEYLAMADNGFGAKTNSRDFLIRAYYVRPEFKTAAGGSGDVVVGEHISFSDPDGLIGFPIVNEGTADRLLTGGDIDPESLQVGRHGDLWVGDEFGPWILHFDVEGHLLEAPIPLPGELKSPNNPFLDGAPATQPNSRGIEGMGFDGRYLYPTLEGATVADLVTDPTRRLMFEYDTKRGEFTGRQWVYRADPATPLVSDVAPLLPHRLVVMERDGSSPGVHRNVYVVDLRNVDGDGNLVKQEVLDLAAIADPDLVSLPPIHEGDIGLGDPFRVVCESVEAIRVVRHDQVLVGCDNNLPNTARNPSLADDNEFIVVKVPDL